MSGEDMAPREITIPPHGLAGALAIPARARGLVIFAHGSGSSRLSPRNMAVAHAFNERRLATLLFDLLTPAEEGDRRNVFDIALLARRLGDAIAWAKADPSAKHLGLGLFGASTGAAAALVAAARDPEPVRAVVSRGGRPDLAGDMLAKVQAPTLLIVGGHDEGVIELNEAAFKQLQCEKRIDIVPGATHLFPEPGALDAVVELASGWFAQHLASDTESGHAVS